MKSFKIIRAVRLFFAVLFLNSILMAQESSYFPLVGDWPYGACNDVEIVENIAYMGNGNFLQTYDVTDKLNPALLGEVKLTGIVYQFVIHNNLAFVAIDEENEDDQDLQIVDISNPGNPVLLGLHERKFSNIVSIMPSSNYIYLLMSGYFEILDVSDPANPVVVETNFDFDSGLKEGKLRDNLLYAANSQIGLQIYDVSDPEIVIKVGELALGDTTEVDPYSIEIRDNYAFLGFDGVGLAIVNISDPANPVKVSSINPPRKYAYNSHIELNDNRLYLADASSGEIYIYDISDVENPRELYKTERVAPIGSMKIREDFLYVTRKNNYSDYFTGLQILSVEDTINPTQASFIATPETLSGFKISEENNEAYFGGYNVFVLDISDKSNPKTKTVIQTKAQIANFAIVDNYMFAAMDEDGFAIYDITNPDAPQQIGYYDTAQLGSGQFLGYARSVTIKDNYAFVAVSYAGLIVLDISDKTNPRLVAHLKKYGGHGMHRDGDYLYVSKFVYGRYIVDISEPTNPTIIADPEEFDIPGGLFTRDNYAYIADTTLHVFDVSDKSNPIKISSTYTGVRGYITILDNKAYIASKDEDGVFIYDITNPGSPVPIESVNLTIEGAVTITQDYIYTAARNAGVKIYKNEIIPTFVEIRESSPSSISLSQNYPNPFNPLTTIEFTLAEQNQVKLTVFDLNGREVTTLVNERLNAGTHSILFDGSQFSSGAYFYRLQTREQKLTRKFTLIK